jgi:hypothetical protein
MDSRVVAPPVLPQVLDRQGFVILGRNHRPPSPKSWCDLKLQRFGRNASPKPFSGLNGPIDRTIGFGYKRFCYGRHACLPPFGRRAD